MPSHRTEHPGVLCRPDDLHVLETARLWVVTSRVTDYTRWARVMAEDPVRPDWTAEQLREARATGLGAVTEPVDSPQPMLPVDRNFLFFAGLDRRNLHLVSGLTVWTRDRDSEVGGAVHRDYRGRGYGHEMLTAVCELAHRHFGIARLTAGCEVTNSASAGWLAKAGFTRTPGPRTLRMPNGRVIETLWWERVDRGWEPRCHRPRPRRRRRWPFSGR